MSASALPLATVELERRRDAETATSDEYSCKTCLFAFLFNPISFASEPQFCPNCGCRVIKIVTPDDKFRNLLGDVHRLLVGLELTQDEGKQLILEVQKVTRRP
jgi:hypothetical protein